MTRALWLVLALVAAACTPPQTAATPSPSASATATPSSAASSGTVAPAEVDMTAALLGKPLPEANVFELTRRLTGRTGQPAQPYEPVRTSPPDERVGTSRQFWTYDFAAKKNMRITATLRIVGDHAKWWVQDGVSVESAALRENAHFFDTKIYPTDRGLYGSEWNPGIDGDPRMNILVARIPGAAAGYYSSSDELPAWVNQYSAEREMVYLNALTARSAWNDIIAHEMCHAIQFGHRARDAVWFDEGQAQLCEQANGFTVSHAQTFIRDPDTQLNAWPQLEDSAPAYGHAYLFLEFLRQHAGGDALINAFLEQGVDTPADLDRILRARGQRPLVDLYADFVAANAFIGTRAVDAAFTYPKGVSVPFPASAEDRDRVGMGATISASVHQYAARYVELPRASMTVTFTGASTTRLLPTDAHSGATVWWSDRADALDSTLTRGLDLRSVKTATLSFWTWYEIEQGYDYAYVEISDDGGARWHALPAPGTTNDDPNGANLGNGFTGNSGGGQQPVWTRVEVDLSAYAGKEVLLRFEHVTDQALNLAGFAVDDIDVSGVFSDDAERDTGWAANGFVRSTNVVAQPFVVQLLRFTPAGATVERHRVASGTLQLDVDTTNDRRPPLLAVSGFAIRTTQPATFQVRVERR